MADCHEQLGFDESQFGKMPDNDRHREPLRKKGPG
jgi:hypothetical protein